MSCLKESSLGAPRRFALSNNNPQLHIPIMGPLVTSPLHCLAKEGIVLLRR